MAWKLDNQDATEAGQMKAAEKKTFNTWAGKVSKGTNPKTAAEAWDSHYEILHNKTKTVDGKKGVKVKCCSIRLSQSNRVFFHQIDSKEFVKVLRYGDHTEPTW